MGEFQRYPTGEDQVRIVITTHKLVKKKLHVMINERPIIVLNIFHVIQQNDDPFVAVLVKQDIYFGFNRGLRCRPNTSQNIARLPSQQASTIQHNPLETNTT